MDGLVRVKKNLVQSNEIIEGTLVHGETDSAEPNENKFKEGASFTEELDVKEEDTLSIAKPELSEREKSGSVKRFKTFVTNLFSTRATESSESVTSDHNAGSVNESMHTGSSSGQTPTAPTTTQRSRFHLGGLCTNWAKIVGNKKEREERAAAYTHSTHF
ncbi:hypothetical protein [Wolbachia endosymbiont (group E) of Neria commutata]|uniref:hypothetical protein n=1 Tax=Wolbachia endosymbiont (group E) of Neria commutata TaxID=3066149 RepID=UPI0031333EB5